MWAATFWLLWNRHAETSKSTEAVSEAEAKLEQDREKQPGLIILKGLCSITRFTSAPPCDPASTKPFDDHVLYLFLVGQTPAVGVNGDQLQHALHYEADLQTFYGAALSLRSSDQADIIGPNNSGSAASLRAGLENAHFDPRITRISVAGITSTPIASSVLNAHSVPGQRAVEYTSFGDNTSFVQTQFTDLFKAEDQDIERLAFLLESGTIYGQSDTIHDLKNVAVKNPLVIHFPREISLLRNASRGINAASDASSETGASPYLHLPLKDSGIEDTVKHFSPELSPFSQEAQWMAMIRELRRRRIEVVAISASNTLDQLFLAKSLHRELPDIRLVFLGSSDLMFVRYLDNSACVGSISFTAYPFTALARSDSTQRLHNFANASTESLFNAAMYTFWNRKDIRDLHLAEYQRSPYPTSPMRIPLWATVVGRDGYYPLGVIDGCASDSSSILPTFLADATAQTCNRDKTNPPPTISAFDADHHSFPAFSWYRLCLVITCLCVFHSLVLLTANYWSPLTRDLALEHGDQPRRRAVYIHIATAMLLSMSFITAYPVVTTLHLLKFNLITAVVAAITVGSGLLAAVLSIRRTHCFLARAVAEPGRKRSPCRRNLPLEEKEDLASEAFLYRWFHLIALGT